MTRQRCREQAKSCKRLLELLADVVIWWGKKLSRFKSQSGVSRAPKGSQGSEKLRWQSPSKQQLGEAVLEGNLGGVKFGPCALSGRGTMQRQGSGGFEGRGDLTVGPARLGLCTSGKNTAGDSMEVTPRPRDPRPLPVLRESKGILYPSGLVWPLSRVRAERELVLNGEK